MPNVWLLIQVAINPTSLQHKMGWRGRFCWVCRYPDEPNNYRIGATQPTGDDLERVLSILSGIMLAGED